MPMYNRAEVATLAAKYGFQRDTFEKVLRLKTVLEFFQEEKILKEHFVLKGGTSINLTIFPLPRLSVDIDMDYIPNDSKENMLATRRKITSVVKEYIICHRIPGSAIVLMHFIFDIRTLSVTGM